MRQKYYHIENGKIINVIVLDDDNNLLEELTVVPFNETVDYNFEEYTYNYTTQQLEYTPIDLTEIRNRKKTELASIRWENENKGTTFAGLAIPTDNITQTKILGAVLASNLDPNYTVKWKTAAGFIELNAVQITTLAQVIREHIQKCFDNEAALIQLIDYSTTREEIESINLNEGWP